MKVLWFTNTACSAAEKLRLPGLRGGWLSSLEQAISELKDTDLYISFYASQAMEPFNYKKTSYYPVHRKSSRSRISRYLGRLTGRDNRDAPELQQLLRVIEQVKPDVIHIHGTEENFGLLQELTTIPVVVSIQGLLSPYSEKFFAGIPAGIARQYEGLVTKIKLQSAVRQHRDMQQKALREQRILALSKNIIGRTDWDRRVTRVLSPRSHYYVNNEMLRHAFYKETWNKNAFSPVIKIVTISSDSLYKGFETLVMAARQLSAPGKLSFEWIVAGLDENSTLVKTVTRWLQCDLHRLNIKLIGSQSEENIAQLLAGADIYCQVSHIENSPNSLCEALLMGMPVIASYAGGTASLLENGKEGLLVQDGDPYSLAAAITELSGQFMQAKQYGLHARKRSAERHDPARITGDLVTIYKNVIRDTIEI